MYVLHWNSAHKHLLWTFHGPLCTRHHSKELERCVSTLSLHHRTKSRCDESSYGRFIQDAVSFRSHGNTPLLSPRRMYLFPPPGRVKVARGSVFHGACLPQPCLPSSSEFPAHSCPPSPAAVRQLGDLVPVITGPQHSRKAVRLESGICLERSRWWADLG